MVLRMKHVHPFETGTESTELAGVSTTPMVSETRPFPTLPVPQEWRAVIPREGVVKASQG